MVSRGRHALLRLDRAGWRLSGNLMASDQVTPAAPLEPPDRSAWRVIAIGQRDRIHGCWPVRTRHQSPNGIGRPRLIRRLI